MKTNIPLHYSQYSETRKLLEKINREKQQKRDYQKLPLRATFLGVLFLITLGAPGWALNQT